MHNWYHMIGYRLILINIRLFRHFGYSLYSNIVNFMENSIMMALYALCLHEVRFPCGQKHTWVWTLACFDHVLITSRGDQYFSCLEAFEWLLQPESADQTDPIFQGRGDWEGLSSDAPQDGGWVVGALVSILFILPYGGFHSHGGTQKLLVYKGTSQPEPSFLPHLGKSEHPNLTKSSCFTRHLMGFVHHPNWRCFIYFSEGLKPPSEDEKTTAPLVLGIFLGVFFLGERGNVPIISNPQSQKRNDPIAQFTQFCISKFFFGFWDVWIWLVVWLPCFIFPYIGLLIIPID